MDWDSAFPKLVPRKWLENKPKLRLVLEVASVVMLLNIFAFMLGAFLVGGSAWTGQVIDGRYFVGSHSELTEVSRAAYVYSQWHTISTMVMTPLGLLLGLATRKRAA